MKKKTILIWALICFIISIGTIQYINYKKNIEVISGVPSEKWSKDKSISTGFAKSSPSIITFRNQIYVAHTTEKGISLVKTNMQGDVIDAKSYDFGKFMGDVTFTIDKENLYISWISIKKGIRSFNIGLVNNELDIKDKRAVEGITESIKLSNQELLISSGDKIKIIDNSFNILFESKQGSFESVAGVKHKGYTYITYFNDKNSLFKVITLEDNKKVKEENIIKKFRNVKQTFQNPTLNINDEELILIYHEFSEESYNGTKSISYNLSNGKVEAGEVKIQGQTIREVTRGDSGHKFFGYVERLLDKRFFQQDIVEFRIKDGKVIDCNYVSNSRKKAFYVGNYKDYVVFCEYIGINFYDIKLTSSEDLFKENMNIIFKEDKKEALNISLEGTIHSFVFIFIIGITWLIFAFIVMGIITFISDEFSEKMSKIIYVGALVLVGLFQVYIVNNIIYGKYAGLMPDYLNLSVGVSITIILYFVSAIFSYLLFKNDIEIIPIIPFGSVLLIETFLVLSVFVPYIT